MSAKLLNFFGKKKEPPKLKPVQFQVYQEIKLRNGFTFLKPVSNEGFSVTEQV